MQNVDVNDAVKQVLSKGVIILADTQSSSEAKSRHHFSLSIDDSIAQLLSPNARVIVWCATSAGEIITDSLEVSVDAAFANEVSAVTFQFLKVKLFALVIAPVHRGVTRDHTVLCGALLGHKFWGSIARSALSSPSPFYPFSKTPKKYKLHIGLHLNGPTYVRNSIK